MEGDEEGVVLDQADAGRLHLDMVLLVCRCVGPGTRKIAQAAWEMFATG